MVGQAWTSGNLRPSAGNASPPMVDSTLPQAAEADAWRHARGVRPIESEPTCQRAAVAPMPPAAPAAGRHYLAGIRACAPVVMGYAVIGAAFGVVARTQGLSTAEVALTSLVLYAGSAQFITAGMLATGAGAPAIILTVFLVNLRHALYSAALAPHLRRLSTWQHVAIGVELTDETFAVASSHLGRAGVASAAWLIGLNMTAQATWLTTSTLGALLGEAIPNTRALGLDFALAAMFAALLVLQIAGRPRVKLAAGVAFVGAIVAVGGSLLIPRHWATIVAAVVASGLGMAIETWRDRSKAGRT